MLDTIACWGIALGFLFSKSEGFTSDCVKILFAMGFILLGLLSKALYVYQKTHTIEIDVDTDENGNLVLNKKEQ